MERSPLNRSEFKVDSSNSSCENVLKIVEQQQQQQQQQQNQIRTKTLKHLNESGDIQKYSTMTLKTLQLNSTQTSATTTTSIAQRKKRLQRQKSTVYSGDEAEYAADLEEEEDDEEDEGYGPHEKEANLNLPVVSNLAKQKNKQVRFRNKQQSESSLKLMSQHVPIEKTFSSSSLTSSPNSSCTNGSHERRLKSDGSFDSISELPHGSAAGGSGLLQRQNCILKRDNSIHSDSSRYSSVDSLLEARKPDPEAILINLGFGPVGSEDILSRIPKRFLKPSQVRGIDTEAFIKRLQLANTLADHSVLGYRGLTGNPDVPPSHIVAKIMERFEVNERKKSLTSMELKLR